MSSNLRVNSIVPASGTNVAIGTAGGTITYGASVAGVSTFTTINATSIVGISTLGVTTAYINTLSGISTISSDAAISINQNLVFPSGKGIDFSATSDATGMTSELLDDYEEGTFSMTIYNANVGTSYGADTFRYTKIGNVVYWNGRIDWTGLTAGSYNELTGLPFTAGTVSENVNFPMTANIYVNGGLTLGASRYYFIAYAQANSTRLLFTQQPNTAPVTFNSSGNLYLTGFYYT